MIFSYRLHKINGNIAHLVEVEWMKYCMIKNNNIEPLILHIPYIFINYIQ